MGGGNFKNIIDIFLPVGIIIEFNEEIDPNTLYPGTTWERFGEGQFLLGIDPEGVYTDIGDTGGEVEHTLSVNEMPSHTHTTEIRGSVGNFSNSANNLYWQGGSGVASTYGNSKNSNKTGNNQPHNNMPPFVIISRWVRTA